MKKLISACIVALAMFVSANAFSQNITCVIKEKATSDNGDKSTFTFYLKGFSNQKEADVFYNKMRAIPEVSAVQDLGKDADGLYKVVAKLKSDAPSMKPVDLASKMGVTHVQKGRSVMTIQEWKDRKKGEAHSDHAHEPK